MSSFLICSTPVHGHVLPLLSVSRFLVSRGHRVRFLTGTRYRAAVEATGATWIGLPSGADYDDRNMDAAFPGRVGLKGPAGIRYDLEHIFIEPGPLQVAAVDEAVAAESTDAVLVESMFIGALALLQRPRDKRPAIVNLGIIPLGITSVDTAPFGLGIPPRPGAIGRLRNRVMRLLAEKVIFAPLQTAAVEMAQRITGKQLTTFVLNWPSMADAIVQFTVPSFEYPRSDLPETVHFVGPMGRTTASEGDLPEWWPDVAAAQHVVHVTQGTVANQDLSALIEPTLAALADEPVLVVVSTGGRALDGLALPANARAATYLPYDKLLPLTDVYITNGGYGGVHYAMENGVPLIVAGMTEDKTEVSARVQWSGAGINLRSDRPSPERIREAVRTVLATPSYRNASAAIGADIRDSAGLDGLERVVLDLIAKPQPTV
ncbi:UDP:flavonoid glycosyltransferase YjiC (YdhE family) [Microbacteriaceae bacterium SG_E_30_P1]|uniref:UDP:flavonoid glycosyltransferase YjiC (YdhE family) n=1 Tax=Antiquaquibacter oligotrophicus TaxID=2880260 RepID=A0ABT6KQ30_9MICO|nr:nucleotide disphospho-sugar-binding domain-containing protein [Antiquaquibacter oligotrophicus]MDH6182085.1 UDP:flavonoid glycosyltransferase YjiC (YdhE family) [Antiquaquibacter oligotrophicus]UDF12249.1 glycosyltransferase [Antiquaquibacter oligotrophicus]